MADREERGRVCWGSGDVVAGRGDLIRGGRGREGTRCASTPQGCEERRSRAREPLRYLESDGVERFS